MRLRCGLAVGLFFLAPLVAEFLLGNLPITLLGALVALAPLYGGGALLIRETVRRTRRGWPSILLLALAYGVVEEGLVTMSLFNPDYAGQRLLDHGFIPLLGIGGPWTLFVLTLHTVWSISVPIALVEALAGERRQTPWLGRLGLGLSGGLFVLGAALVALFSYQTSSQHFVAAPIHLLGAAAVAVLLGGLAFARPLHPAHQPRPAHASEAPPAWPRCCSAAPSRCCPSRTSTRGCTPRPG